VSEEQKEMSIREQIEWYLDRIKDEKRLKSALRYVFNLFLNKPMD